MIPVVLPAALGILRMSEAACICYGSTITLADIMAISCICGPNADLGPNLLMLASSVAWAGECLEAAATNLVTHALTAEVFAGQRQEQIEHWSAALTGIN